MYLYKYVNSKDIREYLKKIYYQFNTIEAAYVVSICESISLKEKLFAWKEIVETMRDMSPAKEMPNCRFDYYPESIHAFLDALIWEENKKLKEYLSTEEGAFLLEFYNKDNNKELVISTGEFSVVATTAYEIRNVINTTLKEDEETKAIERYYITCKPKNSKKEFNVSYNRNGDIMSIETNRTDSPLSYQFEQMWFDFPMPFKKGDVVYDTRYPDSNDMGYGPFVYERCAADYYKERGIKGRCDYTDMSVSGYFQYPDGSLYSDNISNDTLCLEYYPVEKLEGVQRVLIALGNHIKGEIDDLLFANAYHYLLMEEQAKRSKPFAYTDEGLKLAGLEE